MKWAPEALRHVNTARSCSVHRVGMRQGENVREFTGTLRAAQRGDHEAFALLWREYQPGLLRYLTVKSASEAEDLAADIWLKVARALPNFDGDEHGFRSWLFATARNRLTDWYRGTDRRPESIEDATLLLIPARYSVEAEVTDRSDTDAAISMIGTLPPDQAEAVMLRVVAGLEVGQVAMIMARSPGSVRVLCHRGLKRLEHRLSGAAAQCPKRAIQPDGAEVELHA
jgi:RNA polymerase sigma-70 factor (ECF subfamily)